jgi:hypothetical protein
MTVHHEDRIIVGVVGAASLVALLFASATLATPWSIAGKCFALAFVALGWCGVVVPVFIYYFEERDKRVQAEKKRWEEEEQRRLERLQLEEKNGD